ncbi:MAG: YHS domain-containing (seleno)protein [Pseudomonadota bacterium]
MPSRRHFLTLSAALPLAAIAAQPAFAATPETYAEGGVAIDGTDTVAYFTEGAPVPGSEEFTSEWNGATWRFASAENKAKFDANPEAFAPQYGGYCAFAVASGYTASTVPEAWTIHDGKLYLNFSKRIQRRWSRDIPGNIAKGDANWPAVLTA